MVSRQLSVWSLAWNRWKILSELLGDAQARILMFVFYFTVMVPFGLGVRWLSDVLRIRQVPRHWLERELVSEQLDDGRRQF